MSNTPSRMSTALSQASSRLSNVGDVLSNIRSARFDRSNALSDNEFLPAALSILETPQSSVKVRLIWSICLLFLFVVTWSFFGRIDIIAVAQGKVQPPGHVKTIQPFETGRVVAIHVENGQHVNAGDVLVELDAVEASADYQDALVALTGYRAERFRRIAALDAIQFTSVDLQAKIGWSKDIPQEIREREERVLQADLKQLAAGIRSFDAQISQKVAEQTRLKGTVAAQKELLATLQERVALRSKLQAEQLGTKSAVIDAQESLQMQQTALVTQQGQWAEAVAAQDILVQDQQKAIETFRAENAQKLTEVGRQIDDFLQKTAKSDAKLGHMTLKSPISGTVSGSSVTTVGQVVNSSEEVMRVVPGESDDSHMEIEAYIENKDIGFIEPGQTAIVKIESFPFTRYGVLKAAVVDIARDAIPEPDAQLIEGNPAKSTKTNFFGGAQRTQNLVFPVTLQLSNETMNVDGVSAALRPGMAATVEIRTGKRRIIEYIVSPVAQTTASAMKER